MLRLSFADIKTKLSDFILYKQNNLLPTIVNGLKSSINPFLIWLKPVELCKGIILFVSFREKVFRTIKTKPLKRFQLDCKEYNTWSALIGVAMLKPCFEAKTCWNFMACVPKHRRCLMLVSKRSCRRCRYRYWYYTAQKQLYSCNISFQYQY